VRKGRRISLQSDHNRRPGENRLQGLRQTQEQSENRSLIQLATRSALDLVLERETEQEGFGVADLFIGEAIDQKLGQEAD
jgi:hypothetical protein